MSNKILTISLLLSLGVIALLLSDSALKLRPSPSYGPLLRRETVTVSASSIRPVPIHLNGLINAENFSTGPIFKVGVMQRFLVDHPELGVPEFQYLSDEDWLEVGRRVDPINDASIRLALNSLRQISKQQLMPLIQEAVIVFRSTHGAYPKSAVQLKEFIHEPDIEAVLNRYQFSDNDDKWQMQETHRVMVGLIVN